MYAVSSWTGDSWEGDPWNGNPWDGASLKWIGEDIDPSQANDVDAPQNEIELPWYLEGWGGKDSPDDDWIADEFIGNQINGAPITGIISRGAKIDDTNRKITDSMEFLTTDIMGGNAKFISDGLKHQRYLDSGQTGSGFGATSRNVYSNMLVNGFKLSGADNKYMAAAESAVYLNEGLQGYQEIQKHQKFRDPSIGTRQFTKNSRDISRYLNKPVSLLDKAPFIEKALSRFNFVASGISAGYSGMKTYENWDEASKVVKSNASGTEKTAAVTKVTGNAGATISSAGSVVLVLPIPGARVVGGTMIIGGAILWGASKLIRYYAKNWDTIKKSYKIMWNGAKVLGKKGLKSIIKAIS